MEATGPGEETGATEEREGKIGISRTEAGMRVMGVQAGSGRSREEAHPRDFCIQQKYPPEVKENQDVLRHTELGDPVSSRPALPGSPR